MINSIKGFTVQAFSDDPKQYRAKPDPDASQRIKWIEYSVVNRTEDYLMDPSWFIGEWEDLTGEEFPEVYTRGFPEEIKGFLTGGKGRGRVDLAFSILPILDHKGNPIEYPKERLCKQYLEHGVEVYILNDSVFKELVAA